MAPPTQAKLLADTVARLLGHAPGVAKAARLSAEAHPASAIRCYLSILRSYKPLSGPH